MMSRRCFCANIDLLLGETCLWWFAQVYSCCLHAFVCRARSYSHSGFLEAMHLRKTVAVFFTFLVSAEGQDAFS